MSDFGRGKAGDARSGEPSDEIRRRAMELMAEGIGWSDALAQAMDEAAGGRGHRASAGKSTLTAGIGVASGGRGGAPGKQSLTAQLPGGVARRAAARPAVDDDGERDEVQEEAARGVAGLATPLPFLDEIQRSFGRHDVRGIQAHQDERAAASARAIGADAFAMGDHVAFAGPPSLFTAAHEAAHVVQQRRGVQLRGGVGRAGDAYEQHADEVASLVVRGESSEALLSQPAGAPGGAQGADVQRSESGKGATPTTPNVGDPQLGAVMAAIARRSRWILDQIISMLGVQASEAGVIAEADIYAFWSRVLGGADAKARQVTQHIDAATRSALAALTLATAADRSVSKTDAALSHLLDARDHFAGARAALADERDATVAGAQLAIKTCEITIDLLITASGGAVARHAELAGLSKAAQIGIDAGVRFALAGGAKATTQVASGQQLDATVLIAAITGAIDAGASGLTKEVVKVFGAPLGDFLKGALAGTAAQVIKELWGVAAKLLEGKDPPGFTEALVKVVISAIAGGVEFDLKGRGLLPPSTKPVGTAGAADRFLLMLEDMVVKFDLPKTFVQQTSNKAMLDLVANASKKAVSLFMSASKTPEQTPVSLDGPDGLAMRVNELKYAIARYEGEQGNVPEGGVPINDAGATASSDRSGPRGQELLVEIASALEQQPHAHYQTLPLADLRELARLTSWIRDARRILQLAQETSATGVVLRTRWDVTLFRQVVERSERLVQQSTVNGGRSVAVQANGAEVGSPVSKASAAAVVAELRDWLLQIPPELQPGPASSGGKGAGAQKP